MNEFVIIFRDGAEGELEMAGLGKPEQYDESSPSHRLGKHICERIGLLMAEAGLRPTSDKPEVEDAKVITDRAPQLLLPFDDGSYERRRSLLDNPEE